MTQATPQITLRPSEKADYPRIAEIHNMLSVNPTTIKDLEWQNEFLQSDGLYHEMVALDEQQRVVGFNHAHRSSWFSDGQFYVAVKVDRAYHGQGIGALLYHDLLSFVREHEGTELKAGVSELAPGALSFARNRGFQITRHLFPSRLMLADFDEAPFAHVIKEVEASGIHFFSQAEVGNTPEIQRKLYDMNVAALEDEPGFNGPIPPFESAQKMLQDSVHYRLDTQIIAADGDRWVGKTHLYYHPEERYMSHWGAGVERAYRGRHIALALKLLVIRAARRYDVEYLSTYNDSQNAPILAVNRKLGYQQQPGVYDVLCHLTA